MESVNHKRVSLAIPNFIKRSNDIRISGMKTEDRRQNSSKHFLCNIRLIIFLVVNSDTVCLINDVHLNNCEFA